MTETKFTPGPWTAEEAKEKGFQINAGGLMGIAWVPHHLDVRQAGPNADLIAAAPELFEELDRLAGEVRGCWGMAEQALREILGNTNYHIVEERLESSRVAVAKALGRKS